MWLRSLGGFGPITASQTVINTLEMVSGDSLAVMEHTGEDRDKFRRDVTMTGQRAIFCSESLTVPHFSHTVQTTTPWARRARWRIGWLKILKKKFKKNSQLSKSSVSWPDGCVGWGWGVLLCLCGQPDRDQRTKAAEETAGQAWHSVALLSQPWQKRFWLEMLKQKQGEESRFRAGVDLVCLFLKVHRVKNWPVVMIFRLVKA